MPFHPAAECQALQVEKARRPLDICKGVRHLQALPLEDLARAQRPLELAHELLEMVLHDAVQVHELAVDVVDHLDLGRLLLEENRRRAAENLDVTGMCRESFKDRAS